MRERHSMDQKKSGRVLNRRGKITSWKKEKRICIVEWQEGRTSWKEAVLFEDKQCLFCSSNLDCLVLCWLVVVPCVLPWCSAAGLRSLQLPAERGKEEAPRSWWGWGGAVAQISLCKVQHSLMGSSLCCVLGITAGICLGRERSMGRVRKRAHEQAQK